MGLEDTPFIKVLGNLFIKGEQKLCKIIGMVVSTTAEMKVKDAEWSDGRAVAALSI